ncbi:MAG: hypothetical protein JNL01_00965 [Bdellovibrionales bacterium]|nr:hypothetical protein [Bdellovibrionales bacterium]
MTRAAPIFAALFLAFFAGAQPSAWGSELLEAYRSTRHMAMGGTSIAFPEDEASLFMNPAGLAGNTQTRFHPVLLDLSLSQDAIKSYGPVMDAMNNPSGNSLNVLMGKDIAVRASLAPTLISNNFGFAVIEDRQFALLAENQALPQLEYGYMTTRGLQTGLGFRLGRKKSKRAEFRMGLAGKLLWRQGSYSMLPTSQLLNISQQTFEDRLGNFAMGYGFDLGTQVLMPVGKAVTLSTAWVIQDIGDTSFGSLAQPMKMNLSWGAGAQVRMGSASRLTLMYELRQLNRETDWRNRSHLGFEYVLPVLTIYGGLNQARLSYGAAIDVWLARITAAYYTVQTGAQTFVDQQTRWAIRADVKLPL